MLFQHFFGQPNARVVVEVPTQFQNLADVLVRKAGVPVQERFEGFARGWAPSKLRSGQKFVSCVNVLFGIEFHLQIVTPVTVFGCRFAYNVASRKGKGK